ncbi:MAG: hypothetical protein LBR55_05435 [Bacteroidales bacterium]|jgi:hypothetical protein|nr:hypothetical protein [Bacteroidales bacterium]
MKQLITILFGLLIATSAQATGPSTYDAGVVINGVNGCKFTDNATGASLFLPAAGYCDVNYDGALFYAGMNGYYWSSTQYGS